MKRYPYKLYTSEVSAQDVQDIMLENPDITESTAWDWMYEQSADDWQDTLNQLKVITGDFIALADVGTWQGRRDGYSFKGNTDLKTFIESLFNGNYNEFELEVTKTDLVLTAHHHDGTNFIKIRRVVDVRTAFVEDWFKSYFITKHTRRLVKEVCKIYEI